MRFLIFKNIIESNLIFTPSTFINYMNGQVTREEQTNDIDQYTLKESLVRNKSINLHSHEKTVIKLIAVKNFTKRIELGIQPIKRNIRTTTVVARVSRMNNGMTWQTVNYCWHGEGQKNTNKLNVHYCALEVGKQQQKQRTL